MRSRRVLSGLLLAVLVAATACGVVADTTAATVAGESISVGTVDELARNEPLMTLLGGTTPESEGADESRLPGEAARAALGFELQRVANVRLAEKLGLTAGPEVDQEAEMWLQQQEAQLGTTIDGLAREQLLSYIGAQYMLYEFSQSQVEDEKLRILYESHGPRWEQYCLAVAGAPAEAIDEVRELRRSGHGVERIVAEVEGAELVVEPTTACVSAADLPIELVEVVRGLRQGRTSQPVEVQGAVYVVRLESVRRVDFDAAREELLAMLGSAAQSGPQALVAGELASATVNPRYGRSVTQAGVVLPPARPIVPLPTLPDIVDDGSVVDDHADHDH